MNGYQKKSYFSLKVIIIIFSLFNLAALFLFDYELPFFSSSEESDKPVRSGNKQPDISDSFYAFSFDTDPLIYNGTDSLDLLSGVTVKDKDNVSIETDIFVHITGSADSISEKEIEYSADTDTGRITAIRKLKLLNYTGPSISLPEVLPTVTDETLDSVLTSLVENEDFHAQDGYGNDITPSITASYSVNAKDPFTVSYTFTVINLFNDMVSKTAYLNLSLSRPFVLLSQPFVTLKTGDHFNAMSYVETAVDINGESLLNKITIDKQVDTSKPGNYVITYTATGNTGDSSLPQTLTVLVEESHIEK